jgi:flagellar biosynthesis GTPase FlhF
LLIDDDARKAQDTTVIKIEEVEDDEPPDMSPLTEHTTNHDNDYEGSGISDNEADRDNEDDYLQVQRHSSFDDQSPGIRHAAGVNIERARDKQQQRARLHQSSRGHTPKAEKRTSRQHPDRQKQLTKGRSSDHRLSRSTKKRQNQIRTTGTSHKECIVLMLIKIQDPYRTTAVQVVGLHRVILVLLPSTSSASLER